MSLQSMTGFARSQGIAECGAAGGKWTWELRSVNAKGLDIRLRLPTGFEAIESGSRRLISGALVRGNLQAALHFVRDEGEPVPTVNQAALEAVLATVESLRERIGAAPPSAESILTIRGVLEYAEEEAREDELEARNEIVLSGLQAALRDLTISRAQEGNQLATVLGGLLDLISDLVEKVAADPSRTPEAIRERLATLLAPLMEEASALDPQRLHQEAAILAMKADLREEIDRLRAHIVSARQLITSGGPVGRKLDFLAQEFNRECNTICSKSNAATVTALGLEMKVVIDQFREQVQNLE